VVDATTRPLYPGETGPVPTAQEAGWVPGPFWTDAENLAHPRPRPRNAQTKRVVISAYLKPYT